MSSSCTLYWAPSTIPNAGNGCFTAIDLESDAYLPPIDTIVPVFEACPFVDLEHLEAMYSDHSEEDTDQEEGADDKYAHMKELIRSCYLPEGQWIWNDYAWNGWASDSERWMELVNGKTDVDVHSMGFGTLCNSFPGSNNIAQDGTIDDENEEDQDGAEEAAGPGTGAFFPDLGSMKYYTTKSIAAGSELFVEYGASYFAARDYGDVEVQSSRSIEYLQKHGKCIDNVVPGPSQIGPHAGKGAIATRFLKSGSIIAPLPLIHILDNEIKEGSILDLYDANIDIASQSEEDYQTQDISTVPMGKQIMLNYCFGHRDSTILLSVFGPFYYNHDGRNPNARIKWAEDGLGHRSEWLKMTIEELASVQSPKVGLVFDVVALRDINAGDEVTIDYGKAWSEAWDNHVTDWDQRATTFDSNSAGPNDEESSTEEERRDALFDPKAFRHKVMIPDDIFPDSWRNIKRDGEVGASDEL